MEPTERQNSEQSSTQQQTQNNNETSTVVDAELTKWLVHLVVDMFCPYSGLEGGKFIVFLFSASLLTISPCCIVYFFVNGHMLSLFSQYAMTFASVSSATAYSLYKRPKNGIGIMLVAGASGTFADLIYGWNVSCTEQVAASYQYHEQEKLARLPRPRIKFQGMNEGPK
jgi:hypothetical protein